MNTRRVVISGAIAILYYALAWQMLSAFDAGIVATAVVLFGLPSLLLGYYSYAPLPVIVSVATFGLAIAVLLEGVAHVYGLWYTLGIDAGRLFGLVPTEVLIVTTLEVIFLVFLYELFFDDGVYTTSNARTRFGAIGVFGIGMIILLSLHSLALQKFFIAYSFAWVIGIILACSVAALGVYRVYSVQFFDRLVYFAVLGAVPSLIALSLAITNTHKVFANSSQYLSTVTAFGQSVPIEAFVLVFAVPFFVATIYELYLDDQA